MTTLTLHGRVLDPLGLGMKRELVQPPLEQIGPLSYRKPPAEMRTRCFQFAPSELRSRHAGGSVRIDHDGPALGQVVALERADTGVWATATVEGTGCLELLRDPRSWYFSAELHGTPGDCELTGLGVTHHPAIQCLGPIQLLPGDVRDTYTRKRWRVNEGARDRLERAATQPRDDGPIALIDDAPPADALAPAWPRHTATRADPRTGIWHGPAVAGSILRVG